MRRSLTAAEKRSIGRALHVCRVADDAVVGLALDAAVLLDWIPRLARVRGPSSAIAHVALSHRALGITLGRRVYLHSDVVGRDGDVSLPLLAHELAHVVQYRRDGVAAFLFRYLGAYLRGRTRGLDDRAAYLAIPYEVEARAVEAEARRAARALALSPG